MSSDFQPFFSFLLFLTQRLEKRHLIRLLSAFFLAIICFFSLFLYNEGMSNAIIALISLALAASLMGIGWVFWRIFLLQQQEKHRNHQAQTLRFLQVRVPKNAVARSSDIDAKDHTSSMKDNIALMNQIYKNFYAIYEPNFANKHFGNPFISMEIFIEKENIFFILAVPQSHVLTIQQMITAFYAGALVEIIPQPKLLEGGKYMA